jgi:hypothetical protein
MDNMEDTAAKRQRVTLVSRNTVLAGIAASLVAAAWWSMTRERRSARRYADRGQERRNPMHFFQAGSHPLRREIDRSGNHPVFERRQSVYDGY